MSVDGARELGQGLARAAGAAGHRRLLVLSGPRDWAVEAGLEVLVGAGGPEPVLWVSDRPPAGSWSVAANRAESVLGRETGALVFDAYGGFHVDAFGAVSGTLRGGGLLLLLVPPLEAWPAWDDPDHRRLTVAMHDPREVAGRFLQRLVRVIREDPGVTVWRRGAPVPAVKAPGTPGPPSPGPDAGDGCRTEDQRRAVAAILRAATGRARRPVVLTSDRGRGKSAALGIAAARLLEQGVESVRVTGPRLEAVERVFEHAHRRLPAAHASRAALQWGSRRMSFMPPDQLAHEPVPRGPAPVLLVDEAAAIPAPLLERLLSRHGRIVFATTVHGYEGTGRGFDLRFHQVLDRRTPHWRALRLEAPIRWAADDPLEGFVFRALLLNAAAAPREAVAGATADSVTVERVDRDRLAADEAQLSELFGLLVLAHYRTRPFDLRLLLDGPNVAVYLLRQQTRVVGTALVAAEGGFDADTAYRIWAGRTRPHGHLLPESLAAHLGLESAARQRCARILRIAVHPAARGRGLGSRLLAAVSADSRAAGLDYLGSSFGATGDLLRFWHRAGFRPVRLSVTRGAASGAHSCLELQPLSAAGAALAATARERFLTHFPRQLTDPLRGMEPGLADLLLERDGAGLSAGLDPRDWRDLLAFGFARRVYEVCVGPLWHLSLMALTDPGPPADLSRRHRRGLVLKVLQARSWKETAEALDVAGRGPVTALLREAVRVLVRHYADPGIREEGERLWRLWNPAGEDPGDG